MKKKYSLLNTIFIITIMLSSCSNSNSNESSLINKKDSILNNESAFIVNQKAETTIEEFQLVSIIGQFAPHGAVYEYDSIKRSWCERPMAADMLAHATQNNIKDPKKIPDLSSFFNNQTTKYLNSCHLSIKTKGDSIYLLLRYKEKIMYECSYFIQNENNKSKQIKIDRLPNLDISKDIAGEGSMDLSEGREFIITIGKNPLLSFSNDIGNYDLLFTKINSAN